MISFCAAWLLLGSSLASAETSGQAPSESETSAGLRADRILGHWQRGEGEAIIEVSQRNGIYRGVIIWSQKRPETVGTEVFRQLRYDPDHGAWHGRAYSIKRKREVRIDIEVPNRDELQLTAHILIFTRDVDFRRVPSQKLAALRGSTEL